MHTRRFPVWEALFGLMVDDHPGLKPGLSLIPEEYPWRLNELLDGDTPYLLNKIEESGGN